MDTGTSLLLLVALVLVAGALGVLWRSRNGRVRRTRTEAKDVLLAPEELGLHGAAALGERATLLQFSTEYCSQCPGTRRVLEGLAAHREGVRAVDVDLTHRPELARRLGILQTPTIFVLDGHGRRQARIGGAPRLAELDDELDRILRSDHVGQH